MEGRLPAHLEASALVRTAEASGGFAAIVQRGEKDAGVILLVTMTRGANARLWERMPQLDGSRKFVLTKEENAEDKDEFTQYIERRRRSDPDCWVVELDLPDPEHFIDSALQ
ncbi:DUF1491 family protein [Erythrobacter mangrovi]|uniref:DUF1491 family protein n=1 Tax=Erythrobacter mangrovi TaxID=2739433 RepID=A0A7D3X9B8_9SPHN|nr:DUF1491 family protein [Erythrobacter mangrovi]QKG70895.1 DUF1491 family protein [Erythrobacter mangrovi]